MKTLQMHFEATTLLMNTVTLVFVFIKDAAFTRSRFSSFYEQKLIMHMEIGMLFLASSRSSA